MGAEAAGEAGPVYRAFVSYSHADDRFAGWLHRKLEQHRLPDGSRLAPIFIDRAELAAGPDLSAQVRDALANSAALLVIASPSAKASRWVSQEIELFRDVNPDRPVLTALFAGEPADAFPEALLSHQGRTVEPLAADFRDGQDGKRLGLLKIIAGLTGQPLDRLVQRDAQSRQRRVMVVTAVALLLVLILSAALITAIRARAEAERQRADAEGLVEFMLTDLRDKLKGVGRLDIMDAVNRRAMARYSESSTTGTADDDELRRRTRLYLAMAEDDLSTDGRIDEGQREAAFAMSLADRLLARSPREPQNVFLKAQGEFWSGYGYYLQTNRTKAQPHWKNYHALATQLVRLQPNDNAAQAELAYAESNLCTLALMKPVEAQSAIRHCGEALRISKRRAGGGTDDLQSQLDLLNRIGWMADAEDSAGNTDRALALRSEQADQAERIWLRWPGDMRASEARMRAQLGLAKAYREAGNAAQAKASARKALDMVAQLKVHDPANRDWIEWGKQAAKLAN